MYKEGVHNLLDTLTFCLISCITIAYFRLGEIRGDGLYLAYCQICC